MGVEKGADDLECRWKYKEIAVGGRIEEGRFEGEITICPDLMYPLGLREI
jgi:hypothetical protein